MNDVDVSSLAELLASTKRKIQLVDEHIATIHGGRVAVQTADDVASEHRAAFFGAIDDGDQSPGILIGAENDVASFGFSNPKTGTVRVQEDAAFVCTDVLVAIAHAQKPTPPATPVWTFIENYFDGSGLSCINNCFMRLVDKNTGRNLVNGMTQDLIVRATNAATIKNGADLDRGAVSLSYFPSIRPGLGSNVKNKLFSEFTIPRAGAVGVELFNLGAFFDNAPVHIMRVWITLLGYKVYGA